MPTIEIPFRLLTEEQQIEVIKQLSKKQRKTLLKWMLEMNPEAVEEAAKKFLTRKNN